MKKAYVTFQTVMVVDENDVENIHDESVVISKAVEMMNNRPLDDMYISSDEVIGVDVEDDLLPKTNRKSKSSPDTGLIDPRMG